MSKELQELSRQLVHDLDLKAPPIQISYLEHPPEGVPMHPGGAPSVCTFFAEGQLKPFYADLKAHDACEIGAFVLGIPPEGEVGGRLMGTVGMMQKEGYLHTGEEAQIPHNAKPPRYVAYGPLGSLPAAPTSVLLFTSARSAMLALEAAPQGPIPMNGRPMCAIVPTLNQGAKVATSLSCIGSRIYTSMADDKVVVGIRGDYLTQYAHEVRKIRRANDLVGAEMQRRKDASPHPFQAAPASR
jgi:uncharacterized protein (DUF169 family)